MAPAPTIARSWPSRLELSTLAHIVEAARGDLDPADVLSEMVSDKTLAKELRATAANYLLPYKYGKRGVIPVADPFLNK
jgi:hypothetical protein